MKVIRRGIGIFVLGIIAISLGFAASNFSVNSYTVSDNDIYTGETFTFTLNLTRYAGTVQNVSLVNTSADTFVLGNNVLSTSLASYLQGADPATNPETVTVPLSLKYLGSGKTFSFNIINNADGALLSSHEVVINQTREASNTPTTPTDTSKYKPLLKLETANYKDLLAAKENTVVLEVKQAGTHVAKALSATLQKGADPLPFVVDQSQLAGEVDLITVSQSGKIPLKLVVNPAAAPKTYHLEVLLKFQNAYGDVFEQVIPVYMTIENTSSLPTVGVSGYSLSAPLKPGANTQIKLTFENTGSLVAKKIVATVKGFDANGLRLKSGTDTVQVGSLLKGMTGFATFDLAVAPQATGPQTLVVDMAYFDEAGGSYTKSSTVYLDLEGPTNVLKTLGISFVKKNHLLSTTKPTTVQVVVKNNASTTSENLKVTLSSDAQLKFVTPSLQIIEAIAQGESQTISFDVLASSGLAPNTYPIFATVQAVSDTSNQQKMAVSGVAVPDEGETGGSKPKVIIETYDFGGESVIAGETFDLTVHFLNTSQTVGIKNAKVTAIAEGGIFIPVDAANSFFIENIPAGQSVSKTLKFKSKSDAQVKMYTVNFKMSYEDQFGKSYDEKNNPYEADEQIGIQVMQAIRLEVQEPFIPYEVMMGQPVMVETEFYNMGKSILYNMMVKLEGDFQVQDGQYFVGNFEAGRSDYFSGTLYPNAPGLVEGKILFTFEDETGEMHTFEKPIAFNVIEGDMSGEEFFPDGGPDGEFPDGGPDGANGQEGTSQWFKNIPTWAWVLGLLVLLGAMGFVVKRRALKKKKQALLEADDED